MNKLINLLAYFLRFPRVFLYRNPMKIYEFLELFKDLKLNKNHIILNIGCGSSNENFILGLRAKKIYGIDINCDAIKKLKGKAKKYKNLKGEFQCIELEESSFKSNYFNFIISICVLEHIAEYEKTLKECYRILKKKGNLLLSVDSLENIDNTKIVSKHRLDHKVITYFKRNTIMKDLDIIGFKNITIKPILKSNYAITLFTKGILNGFQYNQIFSKIQYIILKLSDLLTSSNRGIFLIIRAEK